MRRLRTMKALVVYESMYGNTALVARAIGDALRERGLDTEVEPIDRVDPTGVSVDVLVAGGPTHVHGMSRATTRATAIKDEGNGYENPTAEPGIRSWLGELIEGDGRPAAAFDTRFKASVLLTGSAAKGIGGRLRSRGYRLLLSPESFLVTKDNTLVEGELGRAELWARAVVEELGVRHG